MKKEWKVITKKRKTLLVNVLHTHDVYKGSYMWNKTGNASSRRKEEFEYVLSFVYRGQEVVITQSLDISCRNHYFSLKVMVDGNKKDVRFLKKIITGGSK